MVETVWVVIMYDRVDSFEKVEKAYTTKQLAEDGLENLRMLNQNHRYDFYMEEVEFVSA